MKYKTFETNNLNKLYLSIFCLSAIMFLFVPSSKNGIFTPKTIELFLINIVIIVFMIIHSRKILNNIWLVFLQIGLLLIYTTLTYQKAGFTDIQIGVALQYFVFGLLAITKVSPIYKKGSNIVSNIFFLINIIMIIWGIGLVFKVPVFIDFTVNNYSHDVSWMLPTMLSDGKPILSFQVHSLAAYFWGMMFFLNFLGSQYETGNRKKMHIMLLFLNFILCLLLKSTTAFILIIIMLPFIIYLAKNKALRTFLLLLIFIGIIFFLQSKLFNYYLDFVLYSDKNGFNGRYGSGLFLNFLQTVKEYGFVGIVINDSSYTYDSGFISNYMRGGLLLIFAYYGSMIKFIFSNLKKVTAIFSSLLFLGLDLITTMLMYPQLISFFIFSILFIKFLYFKNDLNKVEASKRVKSKLCEEDIKVV